MTHFTHAMPVHSLIHFSFVSFHFAPGFTDEPDDLRGFPVLTQLIKGCRGFGFNIVGGSKPRELLQIYSVTANGPVDLKTGMDFI